MVADGAPIETSPELLLLNAINRFGVEAVMGRPLGHNEILCMIEAESIINAYKAKFSQEDWAKWAQDHPGLNQLLTEALKLAEEYGWG